MIIGPDRLPTFESTIRIELELANTHESDTVSDALLLHLHHSMTYRCLVVVVERSEIFEIKFRFSNLEQLPVR